MSVFGSLNTTPATEHPPDPKDVAVNPIQSDSISCVKFSTKNDLLAVASWDAEVRLWEVGNGGQNQGKASYKHDEAVLDLCWAPDGSKLYSVSTDKTGKAYDLATGQSTQFAAHDQAIRTVRYVEATGNMVVTGSWDKTIKYWDLRSSNPAATVTMPERVYAMDVFNNLMVVATAEKQVAVLNLTNPGTIYKTLPSPLKQQTRSIACTPDGLAFAIGSTEGRVAIQSVEENPPKEVNFSFKCHRTNTQPDKPGGFKPKYKADIYSVHTLVYHPFGTLATAGGDEVINIWDVTARTRIKRWECLGGPVTSLSFSNTGQYMAYAISYDWSKGHNGNVAGATNKVMIHTCQEDEVRKKPKK